ncbi:MAG: hypothetical protein FWF25_00265 [Propionibacteriaceae bacterium]|nr:hypothetical protein [Propionibacteriaceae bacterium]
MKIHVLNHHFWPDGSPAAVLEEELADSLREMGYETVLVAGSGSFHETTRPAPKSPIIRLRSKERGKRNSQVAILYDYWRFWKAAKAYIKARVCSGDALLATSSPFLNIFLIGVVRRHAPGAVAICHLHDYLPSNLRSLSIVHRLAAPFLKVVTDHFLTRWDLVLSCAGNIAYKKSNCVVARFWPTIQGPLPTDVPRTRRALYAGNLGIAHDVDALFRQMERLHDDGWGIDFYGDGPMMDKLPAFVDKHPFVSGDDYVKLLCSHPIHFVTGVGRDGTGAFPSKTYNSLYVGAQVVPCGFRPEMLAELERLRKIPDLADNRRYAAAVVDRFLKRTVASGHQSWS